MKRRRAILTAIMAGIMAQTQAEIVLSDDFTVTGGTNPDINAELAGGRNTGTLASTYSSAGNVISPVVDIDDFFGSGGNARLTGTFTNSSYLALDLDTNFGPQLAGQVWELEFSHYVVEQGPLDQGWTGFGITDDPAALTPFGDLGVLMRPTSGGRQWVVFTNGAVANAGSLAYVPYEAILDINVTVNEPNGKAKIYYNAYDPVSTNYLGTEILGTYDIGSSTGDRYVNFRVVADTVSAPDTSVAYYDNMRIETVSASAPQYLFFDSFDSPDNPSVNVDLITRQSNGVILASYLIAGVDHHAIEGNRLKVRRGAGTVAPNANLTAIVGKDFEFGFTLDLDITDTSWTSMYLLSANEDDRGKSRIGLYATGGADETWAYLLYKGTGAAGANNVLEHVSLALMQEKIPGYNKLDPHALKFISTAGPGGTNHYDFVVDGVTIVSNVEYAFSEDTVRKLETINVLPADLSQSAFYDDLYLKIIQGVTYADWAADQGLEEGVNNALTDDPDLDGMDNLLEYALGGNPLLDDAATTLPSSEFNLTGVRYIYNRRIDATLRGLTYGLVVNTNSLQLLWTPVGTTFETGSAAITPEFEAVTNDLPADTAVGFVNLEVSGAN